MKFTVDTQFDEETSNFKPMSNTLEACFLSVERSGQTLCSPESDTVASPASSSQQATNPQEEQKTTGPYTRADGKLTSQGSCRLRIHLGGT
jgi:hypothetical protein